MYTGTTPTLTFSFTDAPQILEASEIVVTFSDPSKDKVVVEKNRDEITLRSDGNKQYIDVFLSQRDTFLMPEKTLTQINFVFSGGYRACSSVIPLTFNKNLKEEIIHLMGDYK